MLFPCVVPLYIRVCFRLWTPVTNVCGRTIVTGHSAGGHLSLTAGILPAAAGLDRQCVGLEDVSVAAKNGIIEKRYSNQTSGPGTPLVSKFMADYEIVIVDDFPHHPDGMKIELSYFPAASTLRNIPCGTFGRGSPCPSTPRCSQPYRRWPHCWC